MSEEDKEEFSTVSAEDGFEDTSEEFPTIPVGESIGEDVQLQGTDEENVDALAGSDAVAPDPEEESQEQERLSPYERRKRRLYP